MVPFATDRNACPVAGIYVLDGDGYRCTLHGVAFSRISTCAECDADPDVVELIDADEPLPDPPEGCLSTRALEAKQVGIGDWATKMAQETWANSDPEWSGRKDAIKLYDLAIKAYRSAGEYAKRREDEYIVAKRDKKYTAMKGQARR